MTNQEVARSFANGCQYCKNASGSLFVSDNAIFSYGMHHTIARVYRDTKTARVNKSKVSKTTSKQTTLVIGELIRAGYTVECVPYVI